MIVDDLLVPVQSSIAPAGAMSLVESLSTKDAYTCNVTEPASFNRCYFTEYRLRVYSHFRPSATQGASRPHCVMTSFRCSCSDEFQLSPNWTPPLVQKGPQFLVPDGLVIDHVVETVDGPEKSPARIRVELQRSIDLEWG
jgi:hypothetical protein